ncbi:MAG: hypothetical protein LUQ36_01180 [Methanoregula sp.]|nr:hypothetical protein [Methanoregula sp.]
MWLELLNFAIGIAFGFFHRGREDFVGILKNSAIIGLILGSIFVIASLLLVPEGISIDVDFLGVYRIFIVIILFVIIFIMGALIGDWLEGALKR